MAVMFSDPFASLFNLQQTLDAFRASSWLGSGPSGIGSYPPVNVFRGAMISWSSSNSRASRSRI
jgi:HSP20 family protein